MYIHWELGEFADGKDVKKILTDIKKLKDNVSAIYSSRTTTNLQKLQI
jgi:hypothetical protein